MTFVTLQKTCEKLHINTNHFYWYCDQNFCIHRSARILKLWETRLLKDGFIMLYIRQSEYGLHQLVRRRKSDVCSYNNLHVIVLQDNILPDLIYWSGRMELKMYRFQKEISSWVWLSNSVYFNYHSMNCWG